MAKSQMGLFPLSEEELRNRSKELARILREREVIEKEKKDANEVFAKRLKTIDDRAGLLAKEIDDEATERDMTPPAANGKKKKGKKGADVEPPEVEV